MWALSGRLALAIAFAGTIALTWIPSDIVKIAVGRPRPDATLLPHPVTQMPVDPSYPSGHVVFVTALVLTLVLMLKGTRWHRPAVVLGTIAVVVVVFSVAILGVHYPTDALASVLWALGVFPAARIVWCAHAHAARPLPAGSAATRAGRGRSGTPPPRRARRDLEFDAHQHRFGLQQQTELGLHPVLDIAREFRRSRRRSPRHGS